MLRTGKPRSEGQIFHRRLLSEYITDFTLDKYVAYFELKAQLKKIEALREEGQKKIQEHIKSIEAGQSARTSRSATPVAKNANAPSRFPPASAIDASATRLMMEEVATPKRLMPRHGSVSVFVDPIVSPAVATMSPLELQEELIAADPSLAKLFAEREALQDQFFDALQVSYKKVKAFLISLEQQIVVDVVALHKLTEAELREEGAKHTIPSIYLKLESVLKYRELNLLAFRKILRKFLERCSCDSLELQHRVIEIDNIISRSNVSQPSLDLREIALDLMAIYGTVFKLTYEQTLSELQQYVARSGRLTPRILPMGTTFFSQNQNKFPPHQERPGSFAIRVLSGTRSKLAEKMITEVLQCPRYPTGSCGKFANGEVSVNMRGKLRGDDVFLVQSMVANEAENFSNSDAVMELMLMVSAAQLAAAARITAVIPYLAYTRNTASIAAIAEMLETVGAHHVVTVDMHSDQVEGMFSVPMEGISAKYEFVQYLTTELRNQGNDFTNLTIVAPNGNFLGKAKDFADAMMRHGKLDSEKQFVSVCTAVKRLITRPERKAGKRTGEESAVSATSSTTLASEGGRASPIDPQSPVRVSPTASGAAEVSATNPTTSTSPTSPNVFDTQFSEVDAMPAGAMNRLRREETFSPTDLETRASSTLGIEKALRRQQVGRRAVVTHQIEETRTEYENYVLVGDVKNRLCVILDTVIDEALNICQVAKSLHANGAERIFLIATHCVLSGKARERLVEAPIELIIVTDSVNQDEALRDPQFAAKLRIVSIAPLLARAIEKIHSENTLATMFDK